MLREPSEGARRSKTYVEKYRKKTGTSTKPILDALKQAGLLKGVIQVVNVAGLVNGRRAPVGIILAGPRKGDCRCWINTGI